MSFSSKAGKDLPKEKTSKQKKKTKKVCKTSPDTSPIENGEEEK